MFRSLEAARQIDLIVVVEARPLLRVWRKDNSRRPIVRARCTGAGGRACSRSGRESRDLNSLKDAKITRVGTSTGCAAKSIGRASAYGFRNVETSCDEGGSKAYRGGPAYNEAIGNCDGARWIVGAVRHSGDLFEHEILVRIAIPDFLCLYVRRGIAPAGHFWLELWRILGEGLRYCGEHKNDEVEGGEHGGLGYW